MYLLFYYRDFPREEREKATLANISHKHTNFELSVSWKYSWILLRSFSQVVFKSPLHQGLFYITVWPYYAKQLGAIAERLRLHSWAILTSMANYHGKLNERIMCLPAEAREYDECIKLIRKKWKKLDIEENTWVNFSFFVSWYKA